MAKLAPVVSLADLGHRAWSDPAYADLAIRSAENLGGSPNGSLASALRWLDTTANETGDEDSVVDEINFCR